MSPVDKRTNWLRWPSLIAMAIVCLALVGWQVLHDGHGTGTRQTILGQTREPFPPFGAQTDEERAALSLPGTARIRKLVELARASEQKRQYADAARLFLLAVDGQPEVADGLLDEAARMEMAAGQFAAAVNVLQRLAAQYADRPIAGDVQSRLAEAYEKAGDTARAVLTHRAVADSTGSVNVKAFHLVRAGELLEQAGRAEEAAPLFRLVLDDLPPNRYSVRAMGGYHRVVYAGNPVEQAEHAEAFGRRMFEAKAFQQAGAALDLAVQLRTARGASPASLGDLLNKAGFALFQTHSNESAVRYYRMLVERRDADHVENLYRLCKLHVRLGDPERARASLNQLLQTPDAADYQRWTRYQIHLLDIQENRYAEAYNYFRVRVGQPGGEKELLEWLAFWTAYRAGQTQNALVHLDALSKMRRVEDAERYAYWRGRLQLERGDRAAGLASLRSLNQNHPSSYYGWRAAELLQQNHVPTVSVEAAMVRPVYGRHSLSVGDGWWGQYPELAGLGAVKRYVSAGLPRSAAAQLARVSIPAKMAPAHAYALAQVCAGAGRHDLARKLVLRDSVYGYLREGNVPLVQSYYQYAMPLGYLETVKQYAARFRLPPAFVFAIMLNESAFHAQIVSPAYAVGLMQILPETGRQIATGLGEPYDEGCLYDPQTNIRYGCWYLRSLLDELGEELVYAAAAYNAGPRAVKQWLRRKKDEPADLFAEEIPYQETNRYVRKVLTAMRQYEVILNIASR